MTAILSRRPDAVFIVDLRKEQLAVREALVLHAEGPADARLVILTPLALMGTVGWYWLSAVDDRLLASRVAAAGSFSSGVRAAARSGERRSSCIAGGGEVRPGACGAGCA